MVLLINNNILQILRDKKYKFTSILNHTIFR